MSELRRAQGRVWDAMTSGRSTLLAAAALPLSLAVTIGIDLGTTNSAVAVLKNGAPVLVPNRRGELTTPSVVAYTAGGVLVGADALEQAASNSANTVTAAKRFIGRPFDAVGEDAARVGVAVGAADGGGVAFSVAAAAPVTPEEVGAQVLLELLRDVEAFAGEPASRAVLAVPAYFDDEQRAATLTAAALAGLDEVTLLAEPVAACVAHGLSGATGRVLVFDLGAGTFDVSVVSLGADGDVEVIATSGDARLGGNDFDAALVQWLGDEFGARGAGDDGDAAWQRRLAEAAEAAKVRLSVLKSVDVQPEGVADGAAVALTRAQLEVLCEPLLQRLRAPLYEVALSARVALPGESAGEQAEAKHLGMWKKPKKKERRAAAALIPEGTQRRLPLGEAVSEVVMVGGASRMAAVRKLVTNLFGVDPRKTVDPMAAVALGACAHAGALSGEIDGVRVLQAWQAQLGRILDAARAGVELEKDDAGDEGEELEQVPDR